MAAFLLAMLKALVAVIGDPVMAGVAVAACKFTVLGHRQSVERVCVQLTRALFDYDHDGSSFLIFHRRFLRPLLRRFLRVRLHNQNRRPQL